MRDTRIFLISIIPRMISTHPNARTLWFGQDGMDTKPDPPQCPSWDTVRQISASRTLSRFCNQASPLQPHH